MTPTARQLLVNQIQGKANQQLTGMVFPYSVRLQTHQHGFAEAMASRAGISRNVIINHLLEVGIEAVLSDLPKDVREAVEQEAGEVIAAALKEKGFDLKEALGGQQ